MTDGTQQTRFAQTENGFTVKVASDDENRFHVSCQLDGDSVEVHPSFLERADVQALMAGEPSDLQLLLLRVREISEADVDRFLASGPQASEVAGRVMQCWPFLSPERLDDRAALRKFLDLLDRVDSADRQLQSIANDLKTLERAGSES